MSSATYKASVILSSRLPFIHLSTSSYKSRVLFLGHKASIQPHRPNAQSDRTFIQQAWLAYPRKDSQDKDSIDTEATEYSKSGTDDAAARQEDAAFDPNKTDPEEQMETAGKGTDVLLALFYTKSRYWYNVVGRGIPWKSVLQTQTSASQDPGLRAVRRARARVPGATVRGRGQVVEVVRIRGVKCPKR